MGRSTDLILLAEDEARLAVTLGALVADAKAVAAFLLDRNGRLLSSGGQPPDLDSTALASLVSGCMAATGSLANLVGEKEFGALFLEGERAHLHVAALEPGLILVVLFDQRAARGLVSFRVRRAAMEIDQAFADIPRRAGGAASAASELAEITDEDIENLLAS
jgi:predicted regulator of Ras-like GTPase activity (Roadblock/LC7/MglB family)